MPDRISVSMIAAMLVNCVIGVGGRRLFSELFPAPAGVGPAGRGEVEADMIDQCDATRWNVSKRAKRKLNRLYEYEQYRCVTHTRWRGEGVSRESLCEKSHSSSLHVWERDHIKHNALHSMIVVCIADPCAR